VGIYLVLFGVSGLGVSSGVSFFHLSMLITAEPETF
jgi:hypothetical protein